DAELLAKLSSACKDLLERTDESGLGWLQTTVCNCEGRLDNVKAGLRVWHDFLSRISSSWATLTLKLQEPKEVISRVLKFFERPKVVQFEDIAAAVEENKSLEEDLRNAEKVLNEASADLDELSSSVVAARDVRDMRQDLRIIQNQCADCIHQLIMERNRLDDLNDCWVSYRATYEILKRDLQESKDEISREVVPSAGTTCPNIQQQKRFLQTAMNRFFGPGSSNQENFSRFALLGDTLQSSLAVVESAETGSEKSSVEEVEKMRGEIETFWNDLRGGFETRISALNQLSKKIEEANEQATELDLKLTECQVTCQPKSVVPIETISFARMETSKALEKLAEYESVLNSTTSRLEEISAEAETIGASAEKRNLQLSIEAIHKRWNSIKDMGEDELVHLSQLSEDAEKFVDAYGKFDKWLKSAEAKFRDCKTSADLHTQVELKQEADRFQDLSGRIFKQLENLKHLNKCYESLVFNGADVNYKMSPDDGNASDSKSLKDMAEASNRRWRRLSDYADRVNRRLKHQRDQYSAHMGSVEQSTIQV
ncbi:unnamed protein product, partial [Notodromas monacha]